MNARSHPRSGRLLALSVAVALALAGCSDGPRGPGTLNARVEGPTPLGAAVVEVVGPGIAGFEGQGDTRVYGVLVPAQEGVHRVVVVSASGAIRFGIKVEDLGADLPTLTALDVATVLNQPGLLVGVKVRVERP